MSQALNKNHIEHVQYAVKFLITVIILHLCTFQLSSSHVYLINAKIR